MSLPTTNYLSVFFSLPRVCVSLFFLSFFLSLNLAVTFVRSGGDAGKLGLVKKKPNKMKQYKEGK